MYCEKFYENINFFISFIGFYFKVVNAVHLEWLQDIIYRNLFI